MMRKIVYEVSLDDPKLPPHKGLFALTVPNDMLDPDIEEEVRRHALAHAVKITWNKVDFLP